MENTGLHPASFKLGSKVIKLVVKAYYNSGPAFGPVFTFVLTTPSHFHCSCGVYELPLHPKSGPYFTLQGCFATLESR